MMLVLKGDRVITCIQSPLTMSLEMITTENPSKATGHRPDLPVALPPAGSDLAEKELNKLKIIFNRYICSKAIRSKLVREVNHLYSKITKQVGKSGAAYRGEGDSPFPGYKIQCC